MPQEPIQTRSEVNGLAFHENLDKAKDAAYRDWSIWKISYENDDGSRTRLVRETDGSWKNEPLMDVVNELLAQGED